MPDGLVAGRGVGEGDVLHLGDALNMRIAPLKKAWLKAVNTTSGRVVLRHLDHLLEAKEVFLRELSAMAVVEGLNNFRFPLRPCKVSRRTP
jgi:hypothetical protein